MSPCSELQQILPGLHRWQSRLQGKHHPVNSYLLNGILIDPAADIPTGLPVTSMLVTHVQHEHVAGANTYRDAPLSVPAGDEYLCAGPEAYQKLITKWEAPWDWTSRGNFQGHLAGARNERPAPAALQISRSLREGDTVAGLRVLATPGHGKNALTLLAKIDGKKVAFCGDLIFGDGQLWNWFDCDWDYGPQSGQKSLLASVRKLLLEHPDVLLPSHGEPIFEATSALEKLIANLENVLVDALGVPPLNFPDNETPCAGWRQLSPHLYQWKDGNCALLVSDERVGLLVDDGLCHWLPLDERATHHGAVMAEIKAKLDLHKIEAVIVTHYHGDHIYNIPILRKDAPEVQVVTLDAVASVMQHPSHFNLAAELWWYGASYDRVAVNQTVRDGELWHWREYDLKIFQLGGQTGYHCGISATIDGARVTFVGDAIYGWNEACEAVLTYNDAEPASRGWLHAIERLLQERPELLVCGHGSAIRDPMPLLQAKRNKWQHRMQDFDRLNGQGTRQQFFSPFISK